MPRPTVVHVASTLPFASAEKIASEVLRVAAVEDLLPLTVAVLDGGGNLVSFKREDGCGVLRGDIAIGKAWGALGMGFSSRKLRDALGDRPAFQNALAAASGGRFIPVPGGVLILNEDGLALGAVGVSGDSSECDEYAAIAAIRAAGYAPDPGEPAPNWKE